MSRDTGERFSKYTAKVHEAMAYAQEEVSSHNQTDIGPEHLLGILDVGSGVTIKALTTLRVT